MGDTTDGALVRVSLSQRKCAEGLLTSVAPPEGEEPLGGGAWGGLQITAGEPLRGWWDPSPCLFCSLLLPYAPCHDVLPPHRPKAKAQPIMD